MSKLNPMNWWRAFLKMPNTSTAKAIGMVFLVALFCSLVVSITALTLKPLQDENRLRESDASIVNIVDLLGGGTTNVRLVELSSGDYVKHDPRTKVVLATDVDTAALGSIESVATVYELFEGNHLKAVILPVRGTGYQSLLQGHLALEADLNTVAALTFHEQAETPGMGARITEKVWLDLWPGKQVTDDTGTIKIKVVRGAASSVHEVDGISGATRTGSGVTALVQFWLGPHGFGPYLARRKSELTQ